MMRRMISAAAAAVALSGVVAAVAVAVAAVAVAVATDAAAATGAATGESTARRAASSTAQARIGTLRLKAFTSCASLVSYGKRYAARGTGAGPPILASSPTTGPREGAPAPTTAPAAPAAPSEQEDSSTNVQEAGVDEPDIVKSARGRIFAIASGRLHAVDARTDTPRLLDSLDLVGSAQELLLSGDRLLVLGQTYDTGTSPEPVPLPGPTPSPTPGPVATPATRPSPTPGPVAKSALAPIQIGRSRTILTEVDISDPTNLRVLRTQTIDGNYLAARLTGDTARVVITSPPPALSNLALRGRLAGWVPSSTLKDARTKRRTTRRVATCGQVRRPVAFSGLGMLTVLTIDLSKGLPAVDTDAVMASGETVYASPTGLYVATQRYVPAPDSADDEPPPTATLIHKFEASRSGQSVYRATGQIPGYLLNQFSLSEYKGILRAATTDTPQWWSGGAPQESQSFVTTMEEQAGALVPVGRVGGLGRGERIYAVRFIDDAGFVVTFRQTDPLFTIDLADPARPRVLGELKVNGYSAYLHPVAKDLLVGVGQDATDQGRRLGVQLSLFDVSDLRAPRRLFSTTLAQNSSTEVEYDHRAFLWWTPRSLAVFPLQVYDDGSGVQTAPPGGSGTAGAPGVSLAAAPFMGAIGLRVGRVSGIHEAGRASHGTGAYDDNTAIRRSLVVGGRLFTLSDAALQAGSLVTLAELGRVTFPPAPGSQPGGGGSGDPSVGVPVRPVAP